MQVGYSEYFCREQFSLLRMFSKLNFNFTYTKPNILHFCILVYP